MSLDRFIKGKIKEEENNLQQPVFERSSAEISCERNEKAQHKCVRVRVILQKIWTGKSFFLTQILMDFISPSCVKIPSDSGCKIMLIIYNCCHFTPTFRGRQFHDTTKLFSI